MGPHISWWRPVEFAIGLFATGVRAAGCFFNGHAWVASEDDPRDVEARGDGFSVVRLGAGRVRFTCAACGRQEYW